MLGLAFAMGTPPGGAPAGGQSAFTQIIPLIIMFAIFYFLLIRPQQKQQQKVKEMLDNLKHGDMVMTTGGIHGKIMAITDNVITLEIADKVRIKVARNFISTVVTKAAT